MKKFLLAFACVASLAFAAPAFAQEVEPDDEVPVTEYCINGQAAPVSVAFTGDGIPTEYYTLDGSYVEFLLSLSNYSSGVAWAGFSSDDDGYFAGVAYDPSALEPGASMITYSRGACPAPGSKSYTPAPTRALYCAAEGNYNPFTLEKYTVGKTLDLLIGQPDTDPAYTGATPAAFVRTADGGGYLTCNAAGFTPTGNKVDSLGNNDGSPGAIYPEHK